MQKKDNVPNHIKNKSSDTKKENKPPIKSSNNKPLSKQKVSSAIPHAIKIHKKKEDANEEAQPDTKPEEIGGDGAADAGGDVHHLRDIGMSIDVLKQTLEDIINRKNIVDKANQSQDKKIEKLEQSLASLSDNQEEIDNKLKTFKD